jgi:hypothetical protein
MTHAPTGHCPTRSGAATTDSPQDVRHAHFYRGFAGCKMIYVKQMRRRWEDQAAGYVRARFQTQVPGNISSQLV